MKRWHIALLLMLVLLIGGAAGCGSNASPDSEEQEPAAPTAASIPQTPPTEPAAPPAALQNQSVAPAEPNVTPQKETRPEVARETPPPVADNTNGIDLGNGMRLVSREVKEEHQNPEYVFEMRVPIIESQDENKSASPGRADAFQQEIETMVSELRNTFEQDVVAMQEYQLEDAPLPGLWIDYETIAATSDLVSILFFQSVYTGGAHPNNFSAVLNYNLQTGAILSLSDVFQPDTAYLETIAAYCINELQTREGVFEDFDKSLTPTLENFGKWNINPHGLMFTFDPYHVGPYAAGHHQVTVPYSELQGMLNPESVIITMVE